MTTERKLVSAFLVLIVALALVAAPMTALAWDSSTEGNSDSTNSSDVQGETSGETSVEGWIGTFDGGEDPNRPDPPAQSWINVKIPATALFGSLASDEGAVYSPVYHIYNYSARDVTITPTSFTKITEPAELSGMTLNLTFTSPSSLTVPLRASDDSFLGVGLTNSEAVNLAAGSASAPTSATFSMSGRLAEGFAYPSDAPYQPTYGLVLSFEAASSPAAS
ncbi:hypothetical protein [Raoultibacter phocaeensis]|uniref:hypothetical protein n=1 Tax=Raoultibacter phocaeensis TaxID=2479841 RepID=UPI00111B837E|nr:hypothetical protein [Raoultibacter phocaeensis]